MLGHSRSALYLREPITQTYLQKTPNCGTVFELVPDDSISIPLAYRGAANGAFHGRPSFPRRILPIRSQWQLRRRGAQKLIIKEVNPLALRWLSKAYDFKLIYLIRHPGSVAASWRRLNWPEVPMDRILGPELQCQVNEEHERRFWTWIGALQALAHNYVHSELVEWDAQKCRVVTYESLCLNPLDEIEELFRFAGLPWTTDDVRRVEVSTTSATDRRTKPYGTRQISKDMPFRWRQELLEEDMSLLRAAYLYYDPQFYTDAW